jgi:pimeloyl-ACP methyl ester carboxylesterase
MTKYLCRRGDREVVMNKRVRLIHRAAPLLALVAWALAQPLVAQDSPPTPARDLRSVQVNGITLGYEVLGEGEPLILLHGFFSTGRANWGPLLDAFAAQYRVILPDLRGHGSSPDPLPEDMYSMRLAAADVAALLDSLGIDQVRGAGISLGAMTLLHLAAQQPERVQSMILVGGGTDFPDGCRSGMAARTVASYPEETWNYFRTLHPGGDERIRTLMEQFRAFSHSRDDLNYTAAELERITTATLIVHGDRDWCFPVSMAAAMHDALPRSYLWIVPNGPHVPLRAGTERDDFRRTALSFLAGWHD